ncbi:MAG: binding-protein-dependent transport system inner rane component [Frankiales bacterium]|nr:binding-protein-dependent transport system inner rane component [Frankiales bacterium]
MAVSEPVAPASAVRLRLPASGIRLPARSGTTVLVGVTLVLLLAPLLAPHSGTAPSGAGPFVSLFHGGALLGTDDLGRDLLSRTLLGARASWLSALLVVASGVLVGGLVGLVAAVRGGWVDGLLMRVTDLFLALPGPVLTIAVVVALGPSLGHVLLAVALVWWPWYARIVRGEVRVLLARPHVDAARLAGVGPLRLARRHLLPGAVPAVLVAASLDVGNLVLALAALSFLGLGAPPPTPELGAMAASGLPYLLGHPWVAAVPATAVFALALVANLAGDAVRDRLDR